MHNDDLIKQWDEARRQRTNAGVAYLNAMAEHQDAIEVHAEALRKAVRVKTQVFHAKAAQREAYDHWRACHNAARALGKKVNQKGDT